MEKRELRWAVIRLEYVRRRCLRGYFQTLGIPLGQGQPRVLERLLFQGAMSQRQLSDACGIDGSTLSRSLDRLEEEGLVRREPEPGSRRSVRVSLTDRGRGAAEKVAEAFEREDRLICGDLTAEQLRALTEALEDMRRRLLEAAREREEKEARSGGGASGEAGGSGPV